MNLIVFEKIFDIKIMIFLLAPEMLGRYCVKKKTDKKSWSVEKQEVSKHK